MAASKLTRLPAAAANAGEAFLRATADALANLSKSLLKPVLIVATITTGLLMTTQQQTQQTAAPQIPKPPKLAPATVDRMHTTPSRVPLPVPNARRRTADTNSSRKDQLHAFHQGAQVFATRAQAIAALADALDIPKAVPTANLQTALKLADSNVQAMKDFVGRYPLPATTSPRLLAALTPADVAKLGAVMKHAATLNPGTYSLTAPMASGNLHLDAHITVPHAEASSRHCYRYALTFSRRSFSHTLTTTACRTGQQWTLRSP